MRELGRQKVCRLFDKIAPIGARDNDWLRLTGDDQRQVQSVRWSVAMRRFLLVAVMCGAASVAAGGRYAGPAVSSRQLHRRAEHRQGQLAGLLRRRPGRATAPADLEAVATAPTATCKRPSCRRPASVTIWLPLPAARTATRTGFGGFVGYNSQWEDVVVGVEANYIHGGFRVRLQTRSGCTYNPDLSIQQPDPFERGREALRFRLAARPRRLCHGMLPALCVCSAPASAARPSIAPFRPYRRHPVLPAIRPPTQQDQAGLRILRRPRRRRDAGGRACSCAPNTNITA